MQNYSRYFEYSLFAVHQETFKIILIYPSQKKNSRPYFRIMVTLCFLVVEEKANLHR